MWNCTGTRRSWAGNRILRIMKLSLFFVTVLTFQLSAVTTWSQNEKLTLKMENSTITDVLSSIEAQTGLSFFYQDEQLKSVSPVNVDANGETVTEVLTDILSNTNLDFRIVDKHVVIFPHEEKPGNAPLNQQDELLVRGKVTDSQGESIPGVTITVKGTSGGTITDIDGNFSIMVDEAADILIFSFVGMKSQEVSIGDRNEINVTLEEDLVGLDEVVVVGYGSMRKSDMTGTVASIPQDRLEMVPNVDITQAIQGAMPGITISTNSAGAAPNSSILIRGRNSIKASNNPLVVLDGIPYEGALSDISPNDIKSIEVLKDASSAAIYGSRGANGVILVTTKQGRKGETVISYDGYYSLQKMANFPELLNGEEFYKFKMERNPSTMTEAEQEIYESGEWVDWTDLALRDGKSQNHTLSVSGGNEKTNFYISGNILDVKGLAVNDKFLRVSNRVNLQTDITDWLTFGTRTSFTYTNQDGISPSIYDVTWMNPLSRVYNDDGTLTLYPNPASTNFSNPLAATLISNIDRSYQLVSNNFFEVDIPFVEGLSYQLNSGIRYKFTDDASYYGRDVKQGAENQGESSTLRAKYENYTVENVLNYERDFGKHSLFFTGVYSFEENNFSSNGLKASGFPHDILTWYAADQASLIEPSYGYSKTNLLSQMLRFNYVFDDRYLFTLTGRRDGYSGFGEEDKWGFFPSFALGWNIANESFFPFSETVDMLKLRISWGENGNQALGAYETLTRLSGQDYVFGSTTLPGYVPSKLGTGNLSWEKTENFNVGVDFALFKSRIRGDLNYYVANTTDLLLDRTISPIHGIGEITQNIGETRNSGFELSINSANIKTNDFSWSTSLNMAFTNNEIVSLYGILDEDGNEIDDVANSWFINEPIQVIYDYEVIGVWQLGEEEEADVYGSEPGMVKIRDVDEDGDVDAEDRVILGQRDPDFTWGLNNGFNYKDFGLSVFVHGMHGMLKYNSLKTDNVWTDISRNTTKKNWWTPENPTNDFYANSEDGSSSGSGNANYYENAGFVRIKDITLSYNLPNNILNRIGLSKARVYFTGRNLMTITDFGGMDPELDGQRGIPLQKEYVFGLNIGF